MMNEHRQSDCCIVPAKFPNKPESENRGGGNGGKATGQGKCATEPHVPDAEPEEGMSAALERIRLAVRREKEAEFTLLTRYNE